MDEGPPLMTFSNPADRKRTGPVCLMGLPALVLWSTHSNYRTHWLGIHLAWRHRNGVSRYMGYSCYLQSLYFYRKFSPLTDLSSQHLDWLLGTAVWSYAAFQLFLDPGICFPVVLWLNVLAFIREMLKIWCQVRVLLGCSKGQKITERKWAVESNRQPSKATTPGDAWEPSILERADQSQHILCLLPAEIEGLSGNTEVFYLQKESHWLHLRQNSSDKYEIRYIHYNHMEQHRTNHLLAFKPKEWCSDTMNKPVFNVLYLYLEQNTLFLGSFNSSFISATTSEFPSEISFASETTWTY